jgi:hypothetical protein
MKYKPQPTKEEAPPTLKGKESTPEKPRTDHKEAPPSHEVKRCKTGITKAYLARFK